MANAVRVTDQTAHGVPLNGAGSPDVLIGNMPAWRALPAGVGDGLEDASKAVKEIMDKPPFTPPEVASKVPEIQAKMMQTAAKAAQAGNPAAASGVTTAFTTLLTTTVSLTAAYTAGAAVPGGEPAARTAFTMGFKAALSSASAAAVSAVAGSWDMHTCPMATPMPHGPGLMTKGSTTVFINGLPAGLSDKQVFEAAGGPAGIQMGCGTVEIGDTPPSSSSGGGGGGGSKSSSSSAGAGGGAGAKSSSSAAPAGGQKAAANDGGGPDEQPQLEDLWVRIGMKPEDAGNDKFVLTSGDGSFSATKVAADDKVPNNDTIDLLFGKVDTSKTYTLEVITEDGSFKLFENLPFADLKSLQGEPDQAVSDEAEDLGEHTGEVESVAPYRIGSDDL